MWIGTSRKIPLEPRRGIYVHYHQPEPYYEEGCYQITWIDKNEVKLRGLGALTDRVVARNEFEWAIGANFYYLMNKGEYERWLRTNQRGNHVDRA